jgi:SAM-dependent methyltransferase
MDVRLNLGCSDALVPGFVNVDVVPPADVVADLTRAWPWRDSSVAAIRAHDVIEHLPNAIHTMNEAHRVLKPGGQLEIVVPTTDGRAAFQDPQHVSFWNRHSFWYYESGNPYRERFCKGNGVKAAFRVMGEQDISAVDGPKLAILLEAVKQ